MASPEQDAQSRVGLVMVVAFAKKLSKEHSRVIANGGTFENNFTLFIV